MSDAPGGWRRNAPTTWFLSEAKARGLVYDLVLDLDGFPSEICAGAALVTRGGDEPAVLVTRTRNSGWELPKGGIEWDELPEEAAVRELREESGEVGELGVSGELGRLEYFLGEGSERRLKQVRYYVVLALREPTLAAARGRSGRRFVGQRGLARIVATSARRWSRQ